MTHTLYWLTNDLRLNDNPALLSAMQSGDPLSLVYVVDPAWFKATNFHCHLLGDHQWTFIVQALADLNKQLSKFNQKIHLLYGQPCEILTEFIIEHGITTLSTGVQVGDYERYQLNKLASQLPFIKVQCFWQHTLFTEDQISQAPLKSFSQFRRYIEKQLLSIDKPVPFERAKAIPRHVKNLNLPSQPLTGSRKKQKQIIFYPGETGAHQHLASYFNSRAPATYKETRNELDGWQNSTKFSPYLAIGNLSPRQIWWQVYGFEQTHGANESTYWIKFELLWREYFQWLALRIGSQLYKFSGLSGKAPLTSFYPERFEKWCSANTPYPLVNACMRELNSTGFISNRGRQIAASCLVNELQVDWRYGAAYFQQMLIDHDVAANWGNWQYIAGVGADPRGGRHFNIEKQTQFYDPKGKYIQKWQGAQQTLPLDSVDESDWPISPEHERLIDE